MLGKKAMGGDQLPPAKAPSSGGHATQTWMGVVKSATPGHHPTVTTYSLYIVDKDWGSVSSLSLWGERKHQQATVSRLECQMWVWVEAPGTSSKPY